MSAQRKVSGIRQVGYGGYRPDAGLGYGFLITNENGAPLVSFSYRTEEEAKAAHAAVIEAVRTAVEVISH